MLDVGVVAVVQAPLAAQLLHQTAVEGAVLAQEAVRHHQRKVLGVRAGNRDRIAEVDAHRARGLVDESEVPPLDGGRRRQLGPLLAALRQSRERPHHRVEEAVGVAAGDAQHEVGLREALPIEVPDVVEGDRLEAGDGTLRRALVGMAGEQHLLQSFEAEQLVVRRAQGRRQVGLELLLVAGEVAFGEARLENDLAQQPGVLVELLAMNLARDDGDLAIGSHVDRRGHRVEQVDELRVLALLGAGLADHQGGESRETLLAFGIVDRAGVEEQAHRDERRLGAG